MELVWTPWAKSRLLPVPGRDAWTLDTSDALSLGDMPFQEVLDFGIAQRVPERYNEKGNHPSDQHGDRLVDTCVATGGVQLATKFLIEVCGCASRGRYELRQDARPWGRLREHLAAASPEARDEAKAIASTARRFDDHRRQAVAFAFCDPGWVREDLPDALEDGYGKLALLASLPSASEARAALGKLIDRGGNIPKYQLVEEGVWFMPNVLRLLEDSDADLVIEAARQAWNKDVRRPWLELVACLPGAAAKAFLAEHGYVAQPVKKTAKNGAKKKSAKKTRPVKKAAAAKRTKPAKNAKARPAKRTPAKLVPRARRA